MIPDHNAALSPKVKAVLVEIREALQRLITAGQPYIVFIDKMGMSREERQQVRDFLGIGQLKIQDEDEAEPAEWLESGTPGVWYGVFYGRDKQPRLETVEVCFYPQYAQVQAEDVHEAMEHFRVLDEI